MNDSFVCLLLLRQSERFVRGIFVRGKRDCNRGIKLFRSYEKIDVEANQGVARFNNILFTGK